MKLKGLHMKILVDGTIEMCPVYHGKRGGNIKFTAEKVLQKTVAEAVKALGLVPSE